MYNRLQKDNYELKLKLTAKDDEINFLRATINSFETLSLSSNGNRQARDVGRPMKSPKLASLQQQLVGLLQLVQAVAISWAVTLIKVTKVIKTNVRH